MQKQKTNGHNMLRMNFYKLSELRKMQDLEDPLLLLHFVI